MRRAMALTELAMILWNSVCTARLYLGSYLSSIDRCRVDLRAKKMTQWVGCLLHKHKDLISDPQHTRGKKSSVAVPTCYPDLGGRDRRLQGASHLGQFSAITTNQF